MGFFLLLLLALFVEKESLCLSLTPPNPFLGIHTALPGRHLKLIKNNEPLMTEEAAHRNAVSWNAILLIGGQEERRCCVYKSVVNSLFFVFLSFAFSTRVSFIQTRRHDAMA